MSKHYYYVGAKYKKDSYQIFCDLIHSEYEEACKEFMELERYGPGEYTIYVVEPREQYNLRSYVICYIRGEYQPNEGEGG